MPDNLQHSTHQQLPGPSLIRSWDTIIAGAGPAGSYAAIRLAELGHTVLLIDKERFPRDKTCGDALIADSIRCLEQVGLLEEVEKLGWRSDLARIFSPSQIDFEIPGTYITLKRSILDALIARRAVEAGAVFVQGKVKDISFEANGSALLSIDGFAQPLQARVGLVATGANVDLLQKLGMVDHRSPSAIAARCYVRSKADFNELLLSYDRSIIPGYAWVFPMGNGEYNLGCGAFPPAKSKMKINLRQMLEVFLKQFPVAREIMGRVEEVGPVQGARLRCGLKGAAPCARGNVLAIGETIGATFPFTGEGIGKAMETGALAADLIHEALSTGDLSRLRSFPERLERDLRHRFLGYQMAEDWLSKAWLNDLLARRARKSTYIRNSLAGIINETSDPREIFSFKGIARSFIW
ncbi:MAG: geranylgeranyl reductase family protein [Acidobacteriota bacterium]